MSINRRTISNRFFDATLSYFNTGWDSLMVSSLFISGIGGRKSRIRDLEHSDDSINSPLQPIGLSR